MFYRLHLCINTHQHGDTEEVRSLLQGIWPLAETINQGHPDAEPSFITFERCYHDESPNTPCEIIRSVSTPLE